MKFWPSKKAKSTIVNETVSKTVDPDVRADITDLDEAVNSIYSSLLNSLPANNINAQLDLLLYLFNNVSEINSLITYIAQKGSDIPVRHVRVLGNGKTKDLGETDIIKLLRKPNPLNSGRTFTINAISSYFVFGFIPINKIKPVGYPYPSELWLLYGNHFYPIPEKSVNQYGQPPMGQDFRLNPIVKYRHFINNRPFDFLPEEIVMINDSNLSFEYGAYLRGQSRLYSAIRSIKTLSYIYDTVITLIANKGAAGFVTKKSKAGEVDSGWDPEDKKQVENKLYAYGTTGGRRPIGVTTKDLGFVRLSVPISEFQPIEIKQHEFRTLATALLFPSVLLNDKEGSIYNNVALAQKAFYTDCLMPLVNLYYEALSEGFGLANVGEKLIADWSGIEALQEDAKGIIDRKQAEENLWAQRYKDNVVTLNEYLRAVGLPEIVDGNKYARESDDIPLVVRLGVGGIQALQSILADQTIKPKEKINILIVVFGIKLEDAKSMVPETVEPVVEPINNPQNVTE